jgi:hypothetical protein
MTSPSERLPDRLGRRPWLPTAAFAVLFLALAAPRWLDPATVLDDTRQFGPALNWLPGSPAVLSPQLVYFADATPPLYRALARLLIDGLGLPMAAALKVQAVLLVLPTVLGLWLLADGLVDGRPESGDSADAAPSRKALFSLFLVWNVLVSSQVLSGTPRDVGTLLLVFALVALLHYNWWCMLPLLAALAGVYPAYGLLLLATLLIALAIQWVRTPKAPSSSRLQAVRACLLALAAVAVAAAGLRVGGPSLDADTWGSSLRLFVGSAAQRDSGWGTLLREAAMRSDGAVKHLEAPLPELLTSGRFAVLTLPRFGILLLAGLIVARRWWRRSPGDAQVPLAKAWPGQVVLAFLVAGGLLYGLAFALAFSLHNPSRYAGLPLLLLVSLAEMEIVGVLLDHRVHSRRMMAAVLCLAVLLAVVGGKPQAMRVVPLEAVRTLQQLLPPSGSPGPQARVLVVNPERNRRLEHLNNSLALFSGASSFYAPELDRGFHLGAIRANLQLQRDRDWLTAQPLNDPTDLPHTWLAARGVTHLLIPESQPPTRRLTAGCGKAIPLRGSPAGLLLVDVACERDHASGAKPNG